VFDTVTTANLRHMFALTGVCLKKAYAIKLHVAAIKANGPRRLVRSLTVENVAISNCIDSEGVKRSAQEGRTGDMSKGRPTLGTRGAP
jgi:hypothetical protein